MKRALTLLSLVLLASAPVSAQQPILSPYYDYFGKNKIVYDTFRWQIYRSTHFAIYFYDRDEPQLQKVASYAESAYDDISRSLNFQIPKPVNLIYYATHSEFEQTNTLAEIIPEAVGAFALPTRNRMVLPVDLPDEKLQKLIAHELTHVFQFEILFGGSFIRAYTSGAPQWLTEGMASYFANDEDEKDLMVLRDAVLNDQVPEIAQRQVYGFFAYRFGHAVFDFMQAEWGKDGVRDFVFDYRGVLGPNIDKVLQRTFGVSAEDFDIRFRRFLRQRFIKILAEKGEPIDFGDRVRFSEERTVETSVRAFPSGDLGAAISTLGEDANIVVFSTRDRKVFKNLTKGYKTRYEYIIAQWLTTGPVGGVDLGVSPDGNLLAFFVRRERGRELVLLNALDGDIDQMIPMPGLDQQLNPAFSPDGRTVAFRAISSGRSDIFTYSLDTKAIANLTNDDSYDFAPAYSPDGQWVYYSSVQGTRAKIFRVRPGAADSREQVTYGDWNDEDAAVSPDGRRLFFASDRNGGIYNIFSIDLDNGQTSLYTNVVGGCFSPIVVIGKDGGEKLVFSAYYKRQFTLYVTDAKKPYQKLADLNPAPSPAGPTTIAPYQPAIEVAIDPEKVEKKPSHKLYLEDAQLLAGVAPDGTFLSNTYLAFGDNLGERHFRVLLNTVYTFTNFYLQYTDLSKRLQKGVEVYDSRQYFVYAIDPYNPNTYSRDQTYRFTGGDIFGVYPINRYYRLEGSVGFVSRQYGKENTEPPTGYPFWVNTPEGGGVVVFPTNNNFPLFGVKLVGDTVQWESFGPASGRRFSLSLTYAPFIGGSSLPGTSGATLSFDATADLRHYFQLTKRSLFAVRLYGFYADGRLPDVLAFGGLDTLRSLNTYSVYGNIAAFLNVEFRFPLIDFIATPILGFSEIRGKAFIDIGGAALKNQPFQFWKDYKLCGFSSLYATEAQPGGPCPGVPAGGLSDYGFGIETVFLGMPFHFDFARMWNFSKPAPGPLGEYRFIFYFGVPSF